MGETHTVSPVVFWTSRIVDSLLTERKGVKAKAQGTRRGEIAHIDGDSTW